jgi:hypothetical protein
MGNIFCTLAIGPEYAGYARFLADDLADFGQRLVVVTDQPQFLKKCRNVSVSFYQPASFSYHDKRLALQAALQLDDTAIFLDADCALRFGVPRGLAQEAFAHPFEPGLHGWSIKSAAKYDYRHTEELAKSWGLTFDRERVVYWEGLFALRRDGGREALFFEIWERFYREAQARNFNGAGEGVCFGIAAQASGLSCPGVQSMRASRLANIFWHTQLDWRRRRLYHWKFAVKSWLRLAPPFDWREVNICGLRSPDDEISSKVRPTSVL